MVNNHKSIDTLKPKYKELYIATIPA